MSRPEAPCAKRDRAVCRTYIVVLEPLWLQWRVTSPGPGPGTALTAVNGGGAGRLAASEGAATATSPARAMAPATIADSTRACFIPPPDPSCVLLTGRPVPPSGVAGPARALR